MSPPRSLRKQAGRALKQARAARGLTQRGLARLAGLGINRVSALENGDSWLRPYEALKVARALRISPDDLQPWTRIQPEEAMLRVTTGHESFDVAHNRAPVRCWACGKQIPPSQGWQLARDGRLIAGAAVCPRHTSRLQDLAAISARTPVQER